MTQNTMKGLIQFETGLVDPAKAEDFADAVGNFLEEGEETPDMRTLNEKAAHLIFVYDSMKESFKYNNTYMIGNGAELLFTGFTQEPEWTMDLVHGKYPLAFRKTFDNKEPPARIKGEVWVVPTKAIVDMDYYNGDGIIRNTVSISTEAPVEGVPNRKKRLITVPAMMYSGIWNKWREDRANGQLVPTKLFRKNVPENLYYYQWTKDMEADVTKRQLAFNAAMRERAQKNKAA